MILHSIMARAAVLGMTIDDLCCSVLEVVKKNKSAVAPENEKGRSFHDKVDVSSRDFLLERQNTYIAG
jgi:hypothetical protein